MATVRKRVLYSGRVQGVGFRFTTRDIARGFAVGGSVRNLPDGRVEVVAEGDEAELKAFLAAVYEYWSGSIAETTETDEPPQGLAGFQIAR